jgi:hypothetical protein
VVTFLDLEHLFELISRLRLDCIELFPASLDDSVCDWLKPLEVDSDKVGHYVYAQLRRLIH